VTVTKKEKIKITECDKELELIFAPTKKQAEMFASLITHKIKEYIADEQVQKDFAKWQKKRNSA